MKIIRSTAIVALVVVGTASIGVAAATASAGRPPKAVAGFACEKSGVLGKLHTGPVSCAKGYAPVEIGAQGPSGVVSSRTVRFKTGTAGSPLQVETGQEFLAGATAVGTITLTPGTYLVTVNAEVTPGSAGTAEVFPVFDLYSASIDQSPPGGNWVDDDVFNVGGQAIQVISPSQVENPGTAGIDIPSYFSGTDQVTVKKTTTFTEYDYGSDSDGGQGAYIVNAESITATQV